MNFEKFQKAMHAQFEKMVNQGGELFQTGVLRSEIWEVYLNAFPEGSNPLYKTNSEHDCNCCKSFLRQFGNVVTIDDNFNLVSIWDFELNGAYGEVAATLSRYVKSQPIVRIYANDTTFIGTPVTLKSAENKVITFEHFHINELPNKVIIPKTKIGKFQSKEQAKTHVTLRGLLEISTDAAQTVLELIHQGSLYRGDQYVNSLEQFLRHKSIIDSLDSIQLLNFAWINRNNRIRNTAIGTLLTDLSNNKPLEQAVRAFEQIMAPANYKRPKALITKSMIDQAQKKLEELGLVNALSRRHATIDDISINNVLFANRDSKKAMNVFDQLKAQTKEKQTFDRVEEMHYEKFINDVLPSCEKIELLFTNSLMGNLVTLVAPVNFEKNMLQWDNNFTWSYSGDFADSIKQRVKSAGGDVTGEVRCSLGWFNGDDLDLHCFGPKQKHIYYGYKQCKHLGGQLDVDMNARSPSNSINPVENITFSKLSSMPNGTYTFRVHQYNLRSSENPGFEIEMEIQGKHTNMAYEQRVDQKQFIDVATATVTDGNVELTPLLPTATTSKEVWNINTETFVNVSVIMKSPNHWDENKAGNQHIFFMLENCKNPDSVRGFYNEFLSPELNEHRKVFEILGSKTKVEYSEEQLSGVGFSTTASNEVLLRCSGSFNRTIKVIF